MSTGPKQIPIETILDLVQSKGLTNTQAAKLLGCSQANVAQRLNRIGFTPDRLNQYKLHRADVLAWLQSMIVSYITPEKLKDASLSQLMIALGILYDKERIERNKAVHITENRSFVIQATATLEEAKAELARLKGKKAAMILGAGSGSPATGQDDAGQDHRDG